MCPVPSLARTRRRNYGKKGAKFEADKLAFERQKLEAERKKLEEERARLAQPVAEDAKWYWEECPERLHLHQNLKRPHWVPYEAEATQKLERAWQQNQTSVPLNASYTANLTAMTQMKNLNGYKRRILRDARPAGWGICKGYEPAAAARAAQSRDLRREG